jgi:hypothetical protein
LSYLLELHTYLLAAELSIESWPMLRQMSRQAFLNRCSLVKQFIKLMACTDNRSLVGSVYLFIKVPICTSYNLMYNSVIFSHLVEGKRQVLTGRPSSWSSKIIGRRMINRSCMLASLVKLGMSKDRSHLPTYIALHEYMIPCTLAYQA